MIHPRSLLLSLCLPLTSCQLSGGDREDAEKSVRVRKRGGGRSGSGESWRGGQGEKVIRESNEKEESESVGGSKRDTRRHREREQREGGGEVSLW